MCLWVWLRSATTKTLPLQPQLRLQVGCVWGVDAAGSVWACVLLLFLISPLFTETVACVLWHSPSCGMRPMYMSCGVAVAVWQMLTAL